MSKALLNDWMDRLGLQDWTIKLYDCCDPVNMDMQNCAGCTTWSEIQRTAVIQIIDPDCYGYRVRPFDYEKTLVHELLHLKTCLLTDTKDPMTERVGHILIEDLARAFVALKREALE